MAKKKLLITGFDPFGGESINPAWEAVRRLPEEIGDYAVTKLQIPTQFGAAAECVLGAAQRLKPDVILSIGQAGGRNAITPELVAINLRDARIPDNNGVQPTDSPVVPGGPAAYFATVPVREMVSAVKAAGIPAERSLSAGAFVCNEVFYTLLHHFDGTDTKVGFIHVPYIPEQGKEGKPSMKIDEIVRGVMAAAGALPERSA